MGLFGKKPKGDVILKEVNGILENCKKYSAAANEAVAADDFFAAYSALVSELTALVKYEKYNIFPKNHPPKADLKRTKITKQNQINLFIRRSYAHFKEKYFSAKNDEKKAQIKEKYFASLKKYFSEMDKLNKKVVEDLEKMEVLPNPQPCE